ncbi:MAG TPA: guanylate kinase [Longimicrobiales bacterium]|nr:guanylate kinase [Longimicrobiales bacterium]
MSQATRPFVLVISAPSGAGKTSLARALVERRDDLAFSVSATTRPPRPHERHGTDYLFVDEAEFLRMRNAGELVEWAEVHGRHYGTPRSGIAAALANGKVAVLDIDVQGARQVRSVFRDAVLVFILPPSIEELGRRLSGRGSENAEERRRRMRTARVELPAVHEFDYLVVNDVFEDAVRALEAIVISESRRISRLPRIDEMVRELDAGLRTLLEGGS